MARYTPPPVPEFIIPADVPRARHYLYLENLRIITKKNLKTMFIFSADQRIEHMHEDFYGEGIALDDNNPHHMFAIANEGFVGAMAAPLGFIAHYALGYTKVPFIAKLNGKTNLVSQDLKDPFSRQLWTVEEVMRIRNETYLIFCGVGLTVYLGSVFESEMLEQAARSIYQAHQYGLLAMLWMYPRGKAVSDERDGRLLAGAVGVANSLGADIVKIHPPRDGNGKTALEWLSIIKEAAGNTRVVCSGGPAIDTETLLSTIKTYIATGVDGFAIGRNIHQKSFAEAVQLTKDIHEAIQPITKKGSIRS